jgi:hypothetical protein
MRAMDVKSRRLTMAAAAAALAVVVGAVVFVVIRNRINQAPAARIVPQVQPIEEDPVPDDDRKVERPGKRPTERELLTRTVLDAQLEVASKEYNIFKAEHGLQLESQWSDLSTFMKFHVRTDNLADAMRRIEAFRSQVRAASHK